MSTLEKALELVEPGGTIVLGRTIYITTELTIENVTIQRAGGFQNALLQPNGGKLTLNNVTLDGADIEASNSGQLLHVQAGECVINEGTRIIRNTATPVRVGGGFNGQTATLTMNGGEISGNQELSLDPWSGGASGAIYFYGPGTLNLNGGTITDNDGANGGAIYAYGEGTINLKGTSITNNSSQTDAGAIYVAGQKGTGITLNVTGGTISGNACAEGYYGTGISAYYFGAPTTVNVSGGTVAAGTAGDGDTGSAIEVWTNNFGADTSSGATLNLSGSPDVQGEVFLWNDANGMGYDAVTIADGFAPAAPISFAGNYGFSADEPTGITYAPGASTDGILSQVSFGDTLANKGLAPAATDDGEVTVVQMVRVVYNSADNQETYATHYAMPGALLDPALAPTEVPATTGYQLAGWSRYPGTDGMWDYATDVAPDDGTRSMTLLATWQLVAPEVTVAAEPDPSYAGDEVTLTASATHPLDDVTFTYQWTRDGEAIDGATEATLEVTEPGSYAVEVTAHRTDASGTEETSDAATSESVKLSFPERPVEQPDDEDVEKPGDTDAEKPGDDAKPVPDEDGDATVLPATSDPTAFATMGALALAGAGSLAGGIASRRRRS